MLTFCVIALRAPAYADDKNFTYQTDCVPSTATVYTAITGPITHTYDTYVKLGIPSQTAQVTVYAVPYGQTQPCISLGTVTANGNTWQKMQSIVPDAETGQLAILLTSGTLQNVPNASRPQVLLIDHDAPVCNPTTECNIQTGGAVGALAPPSNLKDKNSLFLLTAVDPAADILEGVTYYVDGSPVYTTKTLQPFDMRYASGTTTVLQRVAQYQSGQRIIFTTNIERTYQDSIGNSLFRLWRQQPTLFSLILFGIIAGFVLGLFWLAGRWLERRHAWKRNHGLLTSSALSMKVETLFAKISNKTYSARRMLKLAIIPMVAVLLVVFVQMYLLGVYFVNGQSMNSTLHSGELLIINKLPLLLSKQKGANYVPERGAVVVINAVYGNSNLSNVSTEGHVIVKRVIGLPGERVTVQSGKLTVYNKAHPGGYNPDSATRWTSTMHADQYPDGVDVTLGPNEIFVAGDNRPVSIDSRYNGPLDTKYVIGVVLGH